MVTNQESNSKDAVDYSTVLRDAFHETIPLILKVQDDLARNPETVTINYRNVELKERTERTPVIVADEEAQKIATASVRRKLSGGVFALGDNPGIDNPVPESEAKYRIIIDAVDGVTNFLNQKRGNSNGLPDDLATLSEEEQKKALDDAKAWASMIALQAKQQDGTWKTVAGGIYESTPGDDPNRPKSGLLIADESRPGVRVESLSDPAFSAPLEKKVPGAAVYSFSKTFWPNEHSMSVL